MKDILGQALHNYYHQNQVQKLWILNEYGPKEEMPVDTYFRNQDEMPDLEILALNQCRGRVLDIGAGAGSHALILQKWGFDVTALDISGMGVAVMKARGVTKAIEADIFAYEGHKYDTLLLLMNGIGLAGTLARLRLFLQHAQTLLNPGGQLLFDSSDITYLYEDGLPESSHYFGELNYQYEYKGHQTEPFQWLYIDPQTLEIIAAEEGWNFEILHEDEYDQYLVRLTLR